MPLESFALITLAAYYIAYAVTQTHGIFGMFETLREKLPLGGLTTCIYCLLFWAGIGCYALLEVVPIIVYVLAIAGLGTVLHRVGDDY